jgi:hypothetical protein
MFAPSSDAWKMHCLRVSLMVKIDVWWWHAWSSVIINDMCFWHIRFLKCGGTREQIL